MVIANKKNNYLECVVCDSDESKKLFVATDLKHKNKGEWSLRKCVGCGLVLISPIPKNLSKYYPNDYLSYKDYPVAKIPTFKKFALKNYFNYSHLNVKSSLKTDIYGILYYLFTKFNRSRIIPFSKGLLLDIGCGSGEFLSSQKGLGWNVRGIDFNKEAVKVAKKHGLNVIFAQYDIHKFPTNNFDVITASFLFEHLTTPLSFLKKTHFELKKGGLIVIDTPNTNALDLKLFGNLWYSLDTPRHIYMFNKKNISKMLTKNGFAIKKISFSPNPAHFIKSVNFWLNSKKIKFRFSPRNKLFYIFTFPLSLLGLTPEMTIYAKKK
jgi:2-polyprenyl-3-methyl-5-hydroxy-6-metoxy-1,4-benzoquinol methylase